MDHHHSAGAAAVVASWGFVVLGHLADVNSVLQTISLLLATVASIGAIKYYFFTK